MPGVVIAGQNNAYKISIMNIYYFRFNSSKKTQLFCFASFHVAGCFVNTNDQQYQLYHVNEPYNSYLKILDEKGSWEKRG